MKRTTRISSKLSDLVGGELNLCNLCKTTALLGNFWLVLLNVPAQVLLAYAAASGGFAFIANLAAASRWLATRAR
jgi:hypothetical protein